MKCIKKKKEIKRVSDSEAAELVKLKQGWTYCPKHEWKAHRKVKVSS